MSVCVRALIALERWKKIKNKNEKLKWNEKIVLI